jgi:putative N6-adenine-specific DNA methylase
MRFFASCDRGLEGVLAAELTALNLKGVRPGNRGATWIGGRDDLAVANLGSRIANRILVPLREVGARHKGQLYGGTRDVDWSRWFSPDQTLAIDVVGTNTSLRHSGFTAQVIKDAVCDRMRDDTGRRPDVDRDRPDIRIAARIEGDRCSLSLDSSGERLHRRGYKLDVGEAPLRETLAAGLLALCDWNGDRPMLDPMCGSGTLAIEAAMIAAHVAPGLGRLEPGGAGFAFERWSDHSDDALQAVAERLRSEQTDAVPPISASDIDASMVVRARRNAARIGVRDLITWSDGDLVRAEPNGDGGLLLTNPPYGERLSTPEALIPTYAALGDTLKQSFAGWQAGVIAGNRDLAHAMHLKPSRKIEVYNGPIECRLLQFEMYEGSRREPL